MEDPQTSSNTERAAKSHQNMNTSLAERIETVQEGHCPIEKKYTNMILGFNGEFEHNIVDIGIVENDMDIFTAMAVLTATNVHPRVVGMGYRDDAISWTKSFKDSEDGFVGKLAHMDMFISIYSTKDCEVTIKSFSLMPLKLCLKANEWTSAKSEPLNLGKFCTFEVSSSETTEIQVRGITFADPKNTDL